MKKLNFTFILLALGLMSQAQPQKVNYQAVAVNASGVTVKNRVISLKLSILDSSATGSVLYSETHQPTTDGSGQFSVYLGGGTAVSGTFSNIPWGNTKDKFLKAEADLNGGTNYVLMGVSQVVSVPYALHANSASYLINNQEHYLSSPSTQQLSFADAINYCDTLSENGFDDWRMGSFDEFLDVWQTGNVNLKSDRSIFWTKSGFEQFSGGGIFTYLRLFNVSNLGQDYILKHNMPNWGGVWPTYYRTRCYR
jgi:hypothetical protein